MAFATGGTHVFASVGADGSVRLFDLRYLKENRPSQPPPTSDQLSIPRNLEHSTIMYETSDGAPLLRVLWNQQDPNYLACVAARRADVILLDVRVPSQPVAILRSPRTGAGTSAAAPTGISMSSMGAVNSATWAPHSAVHLCSVGMSAPHRPACHPPAHVLSCETLTRLS